jgi:hypothetical protein
MRGGMAIAYEYHMLKLGRKAEMVATFCVEQHGAGLVGSSVSRNAIPFK